MRRLLAVMLLFLILAGCSRSPLPSDQPPDQTPIQNDPAARETVLLDKIEAVDDACREIAEAYAFAFGDSLPFRQGETVAFADVFPYFLCAGVYRLDQEALYSLPELAACRDDRSGVYHLPEGTAEELVERGILTEEDLPEAWREGDVYQIPVSFFTVRRELYPYLDAETNTLSDVPAGLVDGYLTEKFPTTVDHTGIDAYDPDTDTYSFTPLAGDFYYDLTFGSSSLALDGVCMFPVIAAPSGETAAGNTTAGNMAGAENIAVEETTAAGGALAPSETAQTSYPTASGDPQQDQDTYCRVKAEQDAIEIEISNLEAAYRVGSMDEPSFQSQRTALRDQKRELDRQEEVLEDMVEMYYYQTMEIPQGDIQSLLDQLSQVNSQKNDQESQESQLKLQYRNGEISREDFITAMQENISLEEELDVKEELLEDSLERLGWDD